MNIPAAEFDGRQIENPCASVPCSFRRVKNSKYCSKECGIASGKVMLNELLQTLPLSTIKCKSAEDNKDIKKLQKLVSRREMRKINIRDLEAKQRFIDDCIELVDRFRSNDSQMKKCCGFDSLILDLNLPDFKNYLNNAPAENHIETTVAGGNTDNDADVESLIDPNINLQLRATMCKNEGKCGRHDGWEFIKSQEIQLELDEEIRWYCLEKKMEVELAISCGLYEG